VEQNSQSSLERSVSGVLTQAARLGMVAGHNAYRRLRSWLMRMARGCKVDLRTNATKSKPYAVIIAEFDKVFNRRFF